MQFSTNKTTVHNKAIKINDHCIMIQHIEEIEVDCNKVLVYMSSGRKITIDKTNYEKAQEFAKHILSVMGIENE